MPARVIDGVQELARLVGQEVAHSDWLEVPQTLINDFAAATRDHQWIHVDVERARAESPFGSTIAHGFLTLSLVSHLASQALKVQGGFRYGINYGLNRVRFPAPVPAGARIRGRFTLQSLEEFPQGVQAVWVATIEAEGAAKPSAFIEWVVRYYR